MRVLLLFLGLWPLALFAHPGIGIVKDSKGNIYYTDLFNVWKITNGQTFLALRDVHTHELYLDQEDNLYGENLHYEGDATGRFYHSLWVLRPGGALDTIIHTRQAFVNTDYSLARDRDGNEYFLKLSGKIQDTTRIYKRAPNGREVVFARGNFFGVKWLHPQTDGSLVYIKSNNVYRINGAGVVSVIAREIANAKPSFPFSGNNLTVWGAWQDDEGNVYVAVFSDQAVKKIDTHGVVSEYYHSKGAWTPIHGVFDDRGTLWVMECSDKNEIRVVRDGAFVIVKEQHQTAFSLLPYLFGACALVVVTAYWVLWRSRKVR